jgi:sulfite reductase (NADPH) flavoprotein alpha-component
MISDHESITILYGTMMGNAESVAHQVAATLRRAGLSVRVSDMAHCQASLLTRLNSVLIVTSTYGNGEPPDDIIPFWQAVVHGQRSRFARLEIFRSRFGQYHLRSFLPVRARA